MSKLEQLIKNAKEFNTLISQVDFKLKNQEIYGISQNDLHNAKKETKDNDRKIIFKIEKIHLNKEKSDIEFEVILDENLKFEDIKILRRNGFDKKTKITLLIGNGIWRSLSTKEFHKDKICLNEIFKEFIEKNDALEKIIAAENFGEEEFGLLEVLCGVYERNKSKKTFKQEFFNEKMEQILQERNKLFNHVVEKIRNACEEIKKTKTFENLTNEIESFLNNDDIIVDLVTLNYDQLIYKPIVETKKHFDGFLEKNGKLIFNKDFCKWIRRRRNCYCHLHGSLLFREENKSVEKIKTNSLDKDSREPLIVLTGNNSKYQKVHNNADENFILHVYNYHFVQSLCQSNIATIVGYGFLDIYLNNDIIYALAKNPKLIINVICAEDFKKDPDERFISKLPQGINRDQIKINTLNQLCDVSANQLQNNWG